MKKIIYTLIITSFFLFGVRISFAASVSISAQEFIKVGDTFEVIVSVDSGGELINSIDMVVDYPEDLISFAGYKTEEGVVKLWISSPKEANGKISFSGIIPGGVLGVYDANQKGLSAIPLTTLLFKAKISGAGEISFSKSEILKNDGHGTSLTHSEIGSVINIKEGNSVQTGGIEDKGIPEPFLISFIESSLFSATPSMIIFNTNDRESGIKEYQIKSAGEDWKVASSPVPVTKALFSNNIVVRAIDFNNNYREESIEIPGLLRAKYLFLILILLLSSVWLYKLLKYKI
ncbi:MAG: cohesin domain-containing protein [Candidatus Paceibacterota bacterium]